MVTKVNIGNRTINTKELKRMIRRCATHKRPLMLWGPPGVGKSSVVAEVCNELNGKLYDLRLSLLDPSDLRGMPFYNRDSGKMEWAPPIDLPDEETSAKYPVVFLFLDEINGAAPAVQAAAYQLILNRQIGQYTLPDNVVVFAAGNRESDRGVVFRMPSPLANRFVHCELAVDFDVWQEWALNRQIHPDIVGYLNFAKSDLYNFDARSSSYAFATPRSWEFVSDLIYDEDMSEKEATDLVAGAVGDGIAIKFMAHRKHSSKLPRPSDIISGKATTLKTKEISAMYSLVTNVCYELREMTKAETFNKDEWNKCFDYFLRFMMDNFTTEVNVLGARTAMGHFGLPVNPPKLKNFDEFYTRYSKYIISAV